MLFTNDLCYNKDASKDDMSDVLIGFIGGIKFGGKCIANLHYDELPIIPL